MESRPKRPLSAFNLYFRYKRTIILEQTHTSEDEHSSKNKENIQRLITSIPGLESYTSETLSTLSPTQRNEISRTEIRRVLFNNISPNEGTRDRLHRKSHGCMSFIEMSKIMSTSWKSIDEYSKSVFEELAQEGRVAQQEKVAEYEKLNPPRPEAMPSSSDGRGEGLGSDQQQQQLFLNNGNLNQHPFFGSLLYNNNTGVITPPLPIKSQASSQGSRPKSAKKSSKKRSSAKSINHVAADTPTRPKRPLSAYNLFYRYKRMKILKAYSTGHDSKEHITKLLERIPGLEDHPTIEYDPTKEKEELPQYVKDLCSAEIRSLLKDNLSPNDTHDRLHRKSHGCMSFTEMSKIMCDSWKAIDDYAKSVFEELAQRGREVYQERVAAYEKLNKPNIAKRQKLDNYAAKATKINTVRTTSQQHRSKAQQQQPMMNNPADFDQLSNPNHFKNLDYHPHRPPRAQVSMTTQGKEEPSSTTSRPVTSTPPMMMMQPNPSHFQGLANHYHQMLACGGPPPQQQQQQPVQVSPVNSQNTLSLHDSGVSGGAGDTGGTEESGNNSVISSMTIDNMDLEPLPIFPNIFEMSDDEGTQLGQGQDEQGGRAQTDCKSNMPAPIHACRVSTSDGTMACVPAGAVGGSKDIPPSGNDNECAVFPVSQGQAMSFQMNNQYQVGVQPHHLPHPHLPHHADNMCHHVQSSRNMQAQQNQQVGGIMPPPLYSYPRPPSYHHNNSSTSTNPGPMGDAIEDDLMKLLPPDAGTTAILGSGGSRSDSTESVESDRFNLDDFLERIFNEYE